MVSTGLYTGINGTLNLPCRETAFGHQLLIHGNNQDNFQGMADEDAQGQNSITVFIMGFFLSENSIYLDPFGSGVGPLTQVSHEDRSHQICQTIPFFFCNYSAAVDSTTR